MKKTVVLLGLLISLSGWSQNFKFGLTLAPTINFNKIEFKDANDKWVGSEGSNGGLGWKGGLLGDYQFADNYYIHSGLLIHSKAFNSDAYDMSITTLEIPLALKLRSKEVTDNVHITGFFGGTVDLNVAATSKADGKEIDVKDQVSVFGASFMAGAGAEYDLDFGSVGLGLSYHLGLTNISANKIIKMVPKHLSIDLVFYF